VKGERWHGLGFRLPALRRLLHGGTMFCVDEATAKVTRRVFDEEGELSAVIELRQHFPLITDNARRRECVRIIAGWRPVPPPAQAESKVVRLKPRRRPTRAGRPEMRAAGLPT